MKKFLIGGAVAVAALVGVSQIPLVQDLALNAYVETFEGTDLTVDGTTLQMNGSITSRTPRQLEEIFEQHPDIDTVVMGNVPGSIDDEANLKAASWIAKKELKFVLNKDSEIASGGTDFFMAGKDRVVTDGARIGVHSWSGGSKQASDYPKDDPEHQKYITYYTELGWDPGAAEDFYFFTINSAPADGMHWMTNDEIMEYNVGTELVQPQG